MTAKARAATQAIFGDISSRSLPPHRNSREKKSPRDASSFGIQSDARKESSEGRNRPNQTRLKCSLCGSNHWLSHCQGFKGKSLSDRLTFVGAKDCPSTALLPVTWLTLVLKLVFVEPPVVKEFTLATSTRRVCNRLRTKAHQTPLPLQSNRQSKEVSKTS